MPKSYAAALRGAVSSHYIACHHDSDSLDRPSIERLAKRGYPSILRARTCDTLARMGVDSMRKMLVHIVIVSMTAYAQQPSSLEDTLVWMENFVADHGSQFTGQRNTDKGACKLGTPNCEPRHDGTTFESHGCLATVTWSVALNYKDVDTHTYHFSLKDLDPNRVASVRDNPFENAVAVETTNSEKRITESFTPATGKAEKGNKHTRVELVFDKGDNARRFVIAFKHAIQLCGGKPSVF